VGQQGIESVAQERRADDGPPEDATTAGSPPGLARSFARNVSFLAISAVVSRVTGLLAQLVLGRILTEEEFGVFGIALGIMIFTGCLRGGEVHHYLQTIRSDRFEEEAAPFVRVACGASLLGALATLVAAGLSALVAPSGWLPLVLVILAAHAAMPFINAPLRARLLVDGRIALLTKVDIANSMLRVGIVLGAAMLGAGPLTLAIQLLASSIFEAVVLWFITRVPVLRMACRRGGEREAFGVVRWTVLAGVATTSVLQGDYFAASLFAGPAVIGVYYFLFGLCNQSAYLAATMLREAVGPAIARVSDDPDRRASAARRIASGLALVIPAVVFAVPVVFPELDRAVWNGRWGAWEWVAIVLSAHVCLLITTTLLYGTLQGMRDYRTPARLELWRAIGIVAGAGVGAWLSPTPMGIALGVLVIGGTVSGLNTAAILVMHRVTRVRALTIAYLPVLLGVLLASGYRWVVDGVSGWSGATGAGDARWLVEMVVTGVGFFAVYAALARLLFRSLVRDLAAIAPARVARILALVGFR
jgi:O-antigen/teichoic acid export membrane protein